MKIRLEFIPSHTIEQISRFKEYFFIKELHKINIDDAISDSESNNIKKEKTLSREKYCTPSVVIVLEEYTTAWIKI